MLSIPIADDDLDVNIAAVFVPSLDSGRDPSEAWRFQVMYGNVFGLLSAVLN